MLLVILVDYMYILLSNAYLNGFTTLGVYNTSSGFDMYLGTASIRASNPFQIWNLDINGTRKSLNPVSYSSILETERLINFDILQDGKIGVKIQNTTSFIGFTQFYAAEQTYNFDFSGNGIIGS